MYTLVRAHGESMTPGGGLHRLIPLSGAKRPQRTYIVRQKSNATSSHFQSLLLLHVVFDLGARMQLSVTRPSSLSRGRRPASRTEPSKPLNPAVDAIVVLSPFTSRLRRPAPWQNHRHRQFPHPSNHDRSIDCPN